jgi:hypothetical protein
MLALPSIVITLPEITETKETLGGARKSFRCRVLDRVPGQVVVLFVSDTTWKVHDLTLPPGTVTFGYFWEERPYNVYHWMTGTGETVAYYVNLSDHTRIEEEQIHWRDLTVDLLLTTDGKVTVLDLDEIPPTLDPATRETIRRGTDQVQAGSAALRTEIDLASRRLWPKFNDRRGSP